MLQSVLSARFPALAVPNLSNGGRGFPAPHSSLKGNFYAMACKIYFRRVVALLLCCLLAIYTPLLPIAHASDPVTAATLAVTGGQIAAGGLTGEAAISALGGPVGAIVGITLGALGVGTYVSKASADAGVSPTQFVATHIMQYCAVADIKKDQFLKTVMGGVSVAADGAIALSNSAAKAIQQFGSWLVTQGSDTIVPEITESGLLIDGVQYSLFTTATFYTGGYGNSRYVYEFPEPVFIAIALSASQPQPSFLTFTPNLQYRWATVSDNTVSPTYQTTTMNRYFTNRAGVRAYIVNVNIGNIVSHTGISLDLPSSSLSRFWQNSASSEAALPSDDVFTGTPEVWAENKDLLNPSAEDDTPAAVLNPDVLNPIIQQLAEGTQWQMGITDYLKALEAAFDKSITGLGDAVAQLTDVVTGLQSDIAIPDTAVKEVDITKPQVVPDTTPAVVPTEVDPDVAIDGISFQLDEVFPFCLPFDVYKMLSLLSADPVAPHYHVHYEGPYNIVIDFTVDLSAWDNVASICRTMELLLFCVGLAVVTRSIFIRA